MVQEKLYRSFETLHEVAVRKDSAANIPSCI